MKEGTMIRKELHIRPVLAQRKMVGAGFSWPTLVLDPVIASITISKFTWIEDFPVGSRSPTKDPSFDSFHNNRHIAQELPALAEWKSPAPIRIPIGSRAFLPATSEITNDPVVLQLIRVGE
ncbi:PREDICTED: uncharacterized protein LOC18591251 [Theobroma cacao]|uniref:Uncharacterized protein LOC18591251 n=1 Tax=Theobroma cacao TaxID=3641 RepID=A0AB32WTT6_THECC|nr:PREDICTED: uncharacterized protein LOC18591251 [Theobroma cacao]